MVFKIHINFSFNLVLVWCLFNVVLSANLSSKKNLARSVPSYALTEVDSVNPPQRKKRSLHKRKRGCSSEPLSKIYSGKGTHNNENWPSGNCAFTKWPQPSGFGAIAIASNLWNSSQVCGACLEINGPGGIFKAVVENQCPSCEDNSLDLDTDIWSKVSGGQPPGIIQITWKIVACGFSKPIILMNKTGSSKDWTSIQVSGSNAPVTSLEVSTDKGNTWISMVRKSESNYFQDSGGKGLGPKGHIRVTCSTGKKFVTKNVDLTKPDTPTEASNNC